MAKGYYWIPQTDFTLNAMQFYQASVFGDIKFDFKKNEITFKLDKFFPVGSIFHFVGNCGEYVITCRLKKPGLHYVAKRTDDCPINHNDIAAFNSGRCVRRTGFADNKKG